MKEKYILMTWDEDLKYEGFVRYYFKLFDNYFELQKHLMNYWYIQKNRYKIFKETTLTKDYSTNDIKRMRSFDI